MASVTGFGGAFLRADDPEALADWYAERLGLPRTHGVFELAQSAERAPVVLAFFARDEASFPVGQPVMLNLQVDDLDGVLNGLAAAGVPVDPDRPSHDGIGRFGWFTDPEGNRVELWQPA